MMMMVVVVIGTLIAAAPIHLPARPPACLQVAAHFSKRKALAGETKAKKKEADDAEKHATLQTRLVRGHSREGACSTSCIICPCFTLSEYVCRAVSGRPSCVCISHRK